MIFDRVKACIFLLCWVLILSVLASIVEAQAGGDHKPDAATAKPVVESQASEGAKNPTAEDLRDSSLGADPNKALKDAKAQRDALFILFFCALTMILVLYPIGRFLTKQWAFRTDRLFGALTGDAIVYYYQQFRPGAAILGKIPPTKLVQPVDNCFYSQDTSKAYLADFKKDFYRRYGRGYYIGPLFMLLLLTAVSAYWAQKMLREWAASAAGPGASLRALVASALAGAFVWVISDEIDRLRRRDFTSSDVYYYVFRILLAIPFAWAISAVSVDGKPLGLPAAVPVAFFLGAFPTQTLFKIARRFGSQQLHLGDDQDTGNLELEKLQAIGKSNAERFKDEGITTISALAYADPIDLTIRTNFDFSYVVDCVSQALSWIYFGEDSGKLFAFSMRGAQEIAAVIRWADQTTVTTEQGRAQHERAQQTILAAAKQLNISPDAFRTSLDQISEDPYVKFLVNVWS